MGIALSILGLLLSTVGIVLTIRFYSRARLVYQVRELTLVGPPDATPYGEVKILFNDSVVPRVMVTQVAFWNAGNSTVRRNDLVESDPLAVRLDPNAIILGTRTVRMSRAVNDFKLTAGPNDPSRALLTFDYLDKGDGAIFEIIHTGSQGHASVAGSIRGVPKGALNWGGLSDWEKQRSTISNMRIPAAMLAGVVLIYFLGNWIQTSLAKNHPKVASTIEYAPLIPVGLFLIMIIAVLLSSFGYTVRTFWRRLPASLSQQ